AGPMSTIVHLSLEYEPEGAVEQVGDKLGIVERQVTSDLKRFKELIEDEGYATGAWRGSVNDHMDVGTPGAGDAVGSHGDSGKAGVSARSVVAGVAAVAGAAAAGAAAASSTKGNEEEQQPETVRRTEEVTVVTPPSADVVRDDALTVDPDSPGYTGDDPTIGGASRR
ncbi:MAG: cyclase, partial [Actinomycetota bacterium]|nr:cyclase [Actinomycetota bacterium]